MAGGGVRTVQHLGRRGVRQVFEVCPSRCPRMSNPGMPRARLTQCHHSSAHREAPFHDRKSLNEHRRTALTGVAKHGSTQVEWTIIVRRYMSTNTPTSRHGGSGAHRDMMAAARISARRIWGACQREEYEGSKWPSRVASGPWDLGALGHGLHRSLSRHRDVMARVN